MSLNNLDYKDISSWGAGLTFSTSYGAPNTGSGSASLDIDFLGLIRDLFSKGDKLNMTINSRFTDKQIIKKYKRSILVDQFIVFVPMIVSIITIKTITQFFGSFTNVFISTLFILIFGFYLTSDCFMNNSSLGKKIYRIEILNNDHTRKLLLFSVIMRRVMELTYHPLFKRDFISHSRKINSFTSTCVVQKAESHENIANII